MLKASVLSGLCSALVFSLVALPSAADVQRETVTVWKVDTSGRPPFERRRVEVPVADIARLEEEPATELVRVRVTDFTGSPPFRRRIQEVQVVDAARLEQDFGPRSELVTPTPTPFHKPSTVDGHGDPLIALPAATALPTPGSEVAAFFFPLVSN